MAGAIAFGFARWLKICCAKYRVLIVAVVVTHAFVLHSTGHICTVDFARCNLPRPIGASLDTPSRLARAGGIFTWYHKMISYHVLPCRHM